MDAQKNAIPIENAGLVIAAPYFPMLFRRLNMLNDDNRDFKDTESKIRAIFLLQNIATGEEREYAPTELVLNRILVGCSESIPLPTQLQLTTEEIGMIDSLMSAIKSNWSKMANTSQEGFRKSFISRSGCIEQQDDNFILTVESRAYDILLDSLPWSFHQMRYPWMKTLMQVKWR